jgi:hypothetical protein
MIRTEELLAARRLDGGRQYFTRAYDFGFSKTLDDTWQHWPKDTVLKDVVRIVRKFRPQIVVSIFSGTPRDGHGQHQAAGWAAREAFAAAGDSSRFPELLTEESLRPWAPLKLYRSARFDTLATTLTIDGGALDEDIGQTYHQIAMRGRSLHRSQNMGQLQTVGPSKVRLALIEDRTGKGKDGLWAGVDTTIGAMPWDLPSNSDRERPAQFEALLDTVLALPPESGSDRFTAALDRLSLRAGGSFSQNSALRIAHTPEARDQLRHLQRAESIVHGRLDDAIADYASITSGQRVSIRLTAWSADGDLSGVPPTLTIPGAAAYSDNAAQPGGDLAGRNVTRTITWTVPDSLLPTIPYFLRLPRTGSLYQWPAAMKPEWGEPFEAPLAPLGLFGWNTWLPPIEVTFRTNNPVQGEVRRPLTIVPRIDVKLDPADGVWSLGSLAAHAFTVTLTHGAIDSTSGRVRLELPEGWPQVQPQSFRFTGEDERQQFTFQVRAPARLGAGSHEIKAVAEDSRGGRYELGVFTVDYPHIRPRTYGRPSVARINVAPIALPRLARIGYVRGAADEVPEALAGAGLPIELLDRATLARGDLSKYNAIIIGPRAYETDNALVQNNARLLAYVRYGGLLLVQYQQQPFYRGGFAPAPIALSTQGPADRVTDETAAVRILSPNDPVVSTPNRIIASDWDGWLQERGLYFPHTWDKSYRPVLEMNDPGEAPLQGGLLVSRVGKGTYVLTGLSFFRQLPAGVPGAFRLFANLLALQPAATP